jgi:putative transposase
MRRIRHTPEQIIVKLREAEAELAAPGGAGLEQVCQKLGVNRATFYRWRSRHRGIKSGSMQRLKELEEENRRLKKAVAELTLDKQILKE